MKRVLVVEDDALTAGISWQLLIREDLHVDLAPDGEAAIEVLTMRKPDLVLLDLMLPEMNGLDVLKYIRAQPELENLPVIVFTQVGDIKAIQEAQAAGATHVMTKGQNTFHDVINEVRAALAA